MNEDTADPSGVLGDVVVSGLVPAIHAFPPVRCIRTWMVGTSLVPAPAAMNQGRHAQQQQ
jgi:hypothetical protein